MSEGQDARSERPATGMGSPERDANQEHTQVDNLCYERQYGGSPERDAKREDTQVENLCYERQ